jgi:membrane protein
VNLGAARAALDDYQRRTPWLGFPLAVVRKFLDDEAGDLAAVISYFALFSLFPLFLVATTILGFVLDHQPRLRTDVINRALAEIPIIGPKALAGTVHPLQGSIPALALGLVTALWSGMAVGSAAQDAFNALYAVPVSRRPGTVRRARRSMGVLLVVGSCLIVTTIANAGLGTHEFHLGPFTRWLAALLAMVVNGGLFVVAFRWLTVYPVSWRGAWPGAAIAGIGWELLQVFGARFVSSQLRHAHSVYGTFTVFIVLLGWFYLLAQLTLLAAEVNTVLEFRMWPRGLDGGKP